MVCRLKAVGLQVMTGGMMGYQRIVDRIYRLATEKAGQGHTDDVEFQGTIAMYAILDVETTGLSASTGEKITEIAIYIHDGKNVIDSFETLINPEKK